MSQKTVTIIRQSKYRVLSIVAGLLILLLSAYTGSDKVAGTKQARPNIIYIMADDMGYSDIGCYGGEVHTPNLDQLAANGIKLRSFYNNARCCPTRASLLTGEYPHTVGMGNMVTNANAKVTPGPYQGYLDDRYPTIAEDLRKAGYQTLMAGKWHVGENPAYWPRKRGFDHYFGLISGANSYYEIIPQEKGKRHVVLEDADFDIPKEGFYMTDAFTDHAIEFLHENKTAQEQKPFFLYLAYTAPHFPIQAYESDISKYEESYQQGWDKIREKRYQRMLQMGVIDKKYKLSPRPDDIPAWNTLKDADKKTWARKMAVYAAMIDRMDQNIGKLIQTLKQNGQYENTLIVFISDNGGCAENVDGRHFNDPSKKIGERGSYLTYDVPWANVSNTPFRKYKRFMHEGGMISPCIIQWPAKIKPKPGYQDGIGHVIDLLPTSLELAGVQDRDLPGMSLSYLWNGAKNPERTFFWEHEGNQAMRKGNWKLVKDKEDASWELYDLSRDPSEMKDLSQVWPDKMNQMQVSYKAWASKVGVRITGNTKEKTK